ncbi:MAG: glycoside hydrolase family 43 protein [Acidimicrobiia bacterium]
MTPGPARRVRGRLIPTFLCMISAMIVGACTPTPVRTGPDFVSPALDQNFPDPSILATYETNPVTGVASKVWYAFATEGAGARIQMARSTDLLHWNLAGEALPIPPAWADPRLTWAPSVIAAGGEFRLYYSIINASNGEHCVSVARSATLKGPFVDTSAGPVACTPPGEGSIDPSPYVDGAGTPWLVWSTEGNVSRSRVILGGRLDPTGTYVLPGTEATILTGSTNWESKIIEAPHFIQAYGKLWLFYSGGDWKSSKYSIGVAQCDSPRGPCTRSFDLPLLQTRGAMKGPGGPHLVVDANGDTFLAFHAWSGTIGYSAGGRRSMYLLTVYFEDGEPKLGGSPSAVPVTAPTSLAP